MCGHRCGPRKQACAKIRVLIPHRHRQHNRSRCSVQKRGVVGPRLQGRCARDRFRIDAEAAASRNRQASTLLRSNAVEHSMLIMLNADSLHALGLLRCASFAFTARSRLRTRWPASQELEPLLEKIDRGTARRFKRTATSNTAASTHTTSLLSPCADLAALDTRSRVQLHTAPAPVRSTAACSTRAGMLG